jgi:uncharacterized membrane protein
MTLTKSAYKETTKINQEDLSFKKGERIIGFAFFFVLASVITYGVLVYQLYTLDKQAENYNALVAALPVFTYLAIGVSLITIALLIGWGATFQTKNSATTTNTVVILIGWLLTICLSIGIWYLYNENFILTTVTA